MRTRSLLFVPVLAAASLASAGSLSTLYTGGNNGSSLWTNYFDVAALTAPLSITSLALNLGLSTTVSAAGNAFTVDVYTKSGTYSGSETASAVWTLRATGSGTSAAVGAPSAVALSAFTIPVGTTGFAVRYNTPSGTNPVYTDGTGTNGTYSNADMTITAGSSQVSTASAFAGSLFTPRVWNGTVNYTPVPEPTTLAALGLGAIAVLRRRRA